LALSTADSVYSALKALNSGAIRRPITVTVTPTTIQASAKKDEANIRIKVADLFGAPVAGSTVSLTKAFLTSNSGTPLLSNQELTGEEKGTYQYAPPIQSNPFHSIPILFFPNTSTPFRLNLLAAKPEPGAYTLEFRVTPKDNAKWTTVDAATRSVKVVSSVELYEASLTVGDRNDEDSDSQTSLTVGQKLKDQVQVAANKFLHISFRLKNKISTKPVVVQQAFVTFTNQVTGEDIFFVTPYDQSKKIYKLRVDPTKFKKSSGKYTVRIIIGDANIDNSFEWEVGTVALQFKDGAAQKVRSIANLLKNALNVLID